MKKMLVMLALVLTMFAPVMADNDRVISFEQLPAQAQTMLKKNFAHKVPLIVTVDRDDYTVRFQSGVSLTNEETGENSTVRPRLYQLPLSPSRSRPAYRRPSQEPSSSRLIVTVEAVTM